jgi:chemotaxis protein methyltransferase CheR
MLSRGSSEHLTEFICALTTNTTHFFRESVHFDFLKNRLPELAEAKRKQHKHELRVWCSASSTGQEVYTLMMVIQSFLNDANPAFKTWDLKFLATDIDPEVLERASSGTYQETELSGVPDPLKQQFFRAVRTGVQKAYQVQSEYRSKIRFAQFNLLTERYPFQFPFDIIFCRNVLIYFDRPTAEKVIEKLAGALAPGGLLFLGHSETGMMRSKVMKTLASGVYQKAGG